MRKVPPGQIRFKLAHKEECMRKYRKHRESGWQTQAFFWEDIVWEAERALGKEDAEAWLKSIEDIVNDPHFNSMPVTYNWAPFPTDVRLEGKVWVAPHTEAWHKLGVFQIWYPDRTCVETRDVVMVRQVLLEQRKEREKSV